MRRKYVYNPELGEMSEVGMSDKYRSHYIQADIEPFVSPVDGTVIKSRNHLRKYMSANNLAHTDDFKETWNRKREDRSKFLNGARDRKSIEQRISSLKDSFERVRDRERAANGY